MGLDVTKARNSLETISKIQEENRHKLESNNLSTEWDKKIGVNRWDDINKDIIYSKGAVWIEHTSLFGVTYRHEGFVVSYVHTDTLVKVLKLWSTVNNELVTIKLQCDKDVDFGDLDEKDTVYPNIGINGLSDGCM